MLLNIWDEHGPYLHHSYNTIPNAIFNDPKMNLSIGSTKKEKEDPNPITLQQDLLIAYKLISMTSVGENFGSDFTRSFQ